MHDVRNGLLFMHEGQITEIAFPKFHETVVKNWGRSSYNEPVVEVRPFEAVRTAYLQSREQLDWDFLDRIRREDPDLASRITIEPQIDREFTVLNCVFESVHNVRYLDPYDEESYVEELLPVLNVGPTVRGHISDVKIRG